MTSITHRNAAMIAVGNPSPLAAQTPAGAPGQRADPVAVDEHGSPAQAARGEELS